MPAGPLVRRAFGAFLASGVVTLAANAPAQDAPPPIDVPTSPVPMGPSKPPPPPSKPVAKPAPPPEAPKGKAPKEDDKGKGAEGKGPEGKGEDKPGPSINNEGYFKVSGTKGSGYVGKGGKAVKGGTAPASPVAGGKWTPPPKVSTAIVAEWPGFQATVDGGSEVMVEFSRAVTPPTEHRAAGTLTYVFKGAHVLKHNNQHPLLTVHFNTPLLSARLVPKKGELHLVIDMRPGFDVAASTGLRVGSQPSAHQFFVKFPAGSYLPKGDEDVVIEKKMPKKDKTPKGTTPKTKGGSGKGPTE